MPLRLEGGEDAGGLDQRAARIWTAWRRPVTLGMFASAFLAVTQAATISGGKRADLPVDVRPFTVPEISRLRVSWIGLPRTRNPPPSSLGHHRLGRLAKAPPAARASAIGGTMVLRKGVL